MELVSGLVRPRLVAVMGAIVFVDTVFYAAIAPLLPALAHELGLSKLSAGVMTASYPAGTLVGALPSGMLAARAGPKRTVCLGLALLGVSTLAFGWLRNAVLMDGARFVEGLGGACAWAGALAWIVAEAPPERRGALIGSALGAAIVGSLFGPVIGTFASAVGRGPAFSVVVLATSLLIVAALSLPASPGDSRQRWRDVRDAIVAGRVIAAMWLTVLPAVVAGLIEVLAPLRLHRLGASAVAIGAAFLCASAAEAAMSPATGRLSDRRGRLMPLRFGLAATAIVLLCFTLPSSPLGLAAVVLAISISLGAFWAPGMALLSDVAEARGLDQGLAAALGNLAWAGGQIIGSGAGGALAKATGDGLPMALAAGLCVATLAGFASSLRWNT